KSELLFRKSSSLSESKEKSCGRSWRSTKNVILRWCRRCVRRTLLLKKLYPDGPIMCLPSNPGPRESLPLMTISWIKPLEFQRTLTTWIDQVFTQTDTTSPRK
ncbi:hypothetical protein SRHO_G00249290, partial [Serrasalmus rhombeus]